jgi:hypothetical protein
VNGGLFFIDERLDADGFIMKEADVSTVLYDAQEMLARKPKPFRPLKENKDAS